MASVGKVYTVECGEYSSYHVIGVYSTREKAEQVAAAHRQSKRNSDEAFVVERRLDPSIEELNQGLAPYLIEMSKDGLVLRSKQERLDYLLGEEPRHRITSCVWIWKGAEGSDEELIEQLVLRSEVWAKDEKHAITIVTEVRTRLIAETLWTEGWNG